MFTMIFISLIIIFGFEYAGLVNREKNLEFRQSFVKGICNHFILILAINHVYMTEVKPVEFSFKIHDRPLNVLEKENKIHFMYDMLVEAAKNNESIYTNIDALEFFD